MKQFLLFIWQLPQNIAGLLVIIFTKAQHRNEGCWLTTIGRFGVSLGSFIVFGMRYSNTDLKHERGHQKQSLYFGPLYLLLVGVPSLVINLWDRAFHTSWTYQQRQKWYYSKYPEKWADKLGNVHR